VQYLVFCLGEDRDTGAVVDDKFVTDLDAHYLPGEPMVLVSRHCEDCGIKLIDFDGPFWIPLWPMIRSSRRPKWEKSPPHQISADRWEKRLRSTDELAAFRAGLEFKKG
jgi:hypothetical protein